MKRKEFEEKVEQAAARFEERIEAAADRFDKSVSCAAESKWGKRIISIINYFIIAALIAGGAVLIYFSHTVWAIVCFIAAGLNLIWRIIDNLIFED